LPHQYIDPGAPLYCDSFCLVAISGRIACHEALPLTAARRIDIDEREPLSVPRVVCPSACTPSAVNHSRLIGLCGTVALHALVATLFIPRTLDHKTKPLEPEGLPALQAPSAPADDLVLIEINSPKNRDGAANATSVDLQSDLVKLQIPLVAPVWTPFSELPTDDGATSPSAQVDADIGDAEFRARMFGRYTGQISARIERAWDRPHSPVNELRTDSSVDPAASDTFVCEVQIQQDAQRNVQEVLLLACNGTEAWRRSLVVAINQSSPLPAPPIPNVFKRAITMTFEGRPERDTYSLENLHNETESR
jgi:hypothetical protein